MRTTQGNRLLSLQNIQAYLRENATLLGDAISAETRALLDNVAIELAEHAAVQDGHTRTAAGAVARQRARRAALIRDHMIPIARIARLTLEQSPELVSLSMPKGRPSAERLAALAEGMALAAEPHAALFVGLGCKPEFIQNLRAAATELLHALHDRAQSRGKVREATFALEMKLSRARKLVQVIDGFLTSALVDEPDRLAGWKLVKRVRGSRSGAGVVSNADPVTTGEALPEILAGTPGQVPTSAPALVSAAA